MIIEFAGLPGSGKSTAAEHLAKAAAKRGITVLTARHLSEPVSSFPFWPRLQQRLALARSVITHPRMAVVLTLGLVRSPRSRFEKWYSFRHVIVTVTLLRRARLVTDPNTLTVLHEGMCQRVFQAFVDGRGVADRRTVRQFLRHVPLPDVIVGLKVPPETALARVRSRGHGGLSDRFDDLSDAQLHERLADGQQLLIWTLGYLETRDTPEVGTLMLDAQDLPGLLQQLDSDCIPMLLEDLNASSAHDA